MTPKEAQEASRDIAGVCADIRRLKEQRTRSTMRDQERLTIEIEDLEQTLVALANPQQGEMQ